MFLYHFYDARSGSFRSLTFISQDEAREVIERIKLERPKSQCASRHDKYVEYRHNCERMLREAFAKKGGIMEIDSPHYMVLEFSPWLLRWWEKHAEEGKKNGL